MRKLAALFIAFLFSSTASAIPLLYQEGVHYQVISETASAKPNVTEYFSFFCGHCYKFEPVAKNIEKVLPKNVEFIKSHVDTMTFTGHDAQKILSFALVASNELNLGHVITDTIFDRIHRQQKPFADMAEIKALFVKHGVDGKKFDEIIKSDAAKSAVVRMRSEISEWSKRRVMTGVPMVVINGKYKLITEGLKSKADYDGVVKFLLSMR